MSIDVTVTAYGEASPRGPYRPAPRYQDTVIRLNPSPPTTVFVSGSTRQWSGSTFETTVDGCFALWSADDTQHSDHPGVRFEGSHVVLVHPGDYVLTVEMAPGSDAALRMKSGEATMDEYHYPTWKTYTCTAVRCVVRVVVDNAVLRVFSEYGVMLHGSRLSVRKL